MFRRLTVIGTGSGKAENITLRAWQAIKTADTVLLRTVRMPVVTLLKEHGIPFSALDACYEQAEDFEMLNELLLQAVCDCSGDCCILMHGSGQDDRFAEYILKYCAGQKLPCEFLPGISLASAAAAALGVFGAYSTCTAQEGAQKDFDIRQSQLITCLDSPLLASELKCRLLEFYDPLLSVGLYREDDEGDSYTLTLPLEELDRQPVYHHTACVYLKAQRLEQAVRYDYFHLLEIMERLRSKNGCPWDREQTHASLKPYLLEEAYEAIDAIEEDDMDKLYDELGDVLLQVVFHAQVAAEHGEFTHRDITHAVCEKMIRRHPHIFADTRADTSEQVLVNWENIKKEEKQLKNHADVLRDIPKAFPALLRVQKIQQKAAKAGFDWTDYKGAFQKLPEEYAELAQALENGSPEEIEEETGDLLFTLVNIARHAGVQPELALYRSGEKFIRRFTLMEELISQSGRFLEDMSLEELDIYWEKAKQKIRNGK